jgi:hypothetical protein
VIDPDQLESTESIGHVEAAVAAIGLALNDDASVAKLTEEVLSGFVKEIHDSPEMLDHSERQTPFRPESAQSMHPRNFKEIKSHLLLVTADDPATELLHQIK